MPKLKLIHGFQPRHVVTMVVAVCVAVVLAPVAVFAATGQLVNIADGSNAARLSKLNGSNELAVTQRPSGDGVSNAFTLSAPAARVLLGQNAGPGRVALTQLTIAQASGTAGSAQFIMRGWYRTSGTGTCANVAAGTSAGFTGLIMRRLAVPYGETLVLDWNGPALLSPATGVGVPNCLTLDYLSGANTPAYVGATVFIYTP